MAFGWDDAFILSMAAAGTGISFYQSKQNVDLIRMGRQLEQSAVETNLEALRTESAQSSLSALNELQENVSNQIAMNAARGVSSGAGSASSAISQSESNFSKDEQKRRLNLLVKENELRAAGVLSGLHTLTSETKAGQSLTNQIFNNLPISTLADRFNVGSKNKSGGQGSGTSPGKKTGFGLTAVGA